MQLPLFGRSQGHAASPAVAELPAEVCVPHARGSSLLRQPLSGLAITALGLLLCAKTCESATAVKRQTSALLRTEDGIVERPESVHGQVSLEIGSHAALQAEQHGKAGAGYPFKPRVIQIFYEALCPDSARLLSNKQAGLWSSYNSRKDSWRIDLYPFGNAHRDTFNNVICQHGSEECAGNLMHQCALQLLQPTEAFALIDCLMDSVNTIYTTGSQSANLLQGNGSWVYDDNVQDGTSPTRTHGITSFKTQVADPCFQRLHQPKWEATISPCISNGTMTNSVVSYYETESKRVNYSWVPAVYINGTFDTHASHGNDLLSYLDPTCDAADTHWADEALKIGGHQADYDQVMDAPCVKRHEEYSKLKDASQ